VSRGRSATSARSTRCALTRRRRRIRPREPTSERSRDEGQRVDRDDDHRVAEDVIRIARTRNGAERLERDPGHPDDRAVVNTGVIGPFSGHEPAESDTEDGGDDARDGARRGSTRKTTKTATANPARTARQRNRWSDRRSKE